MSYRLCPSRLVPAALFLCICLPSEGQAQVLLGVGVGTGPGYGYGPLRLRRLWRLRPLCTVDLPGAPRRAVHDTGYPFYGFPGYRGANGGFWSNGLHLSGPPVPVYGPMPGVLGNSDFVHQWQARPTLGLGVAYFGWVGPYPFAPAVPHVSERMARARAVVWPRQRRCRTRRLSHPLREGAAARRRGLRRRREDDPDRHRPCLRIAARRSGQGIRYSLTARWIENGATIERTKVATGKPGEVVRWISACRTWCRSAAEGG